MRGFRLGLVLALVNGWRDVFLVEGGAESVLSHNSADGASSYAMNSQSTVLEKNHRSAKGGTHWGGEWGFDGDGDGPRRVRTRQLEGERTLFAKADPNLDEAPSPLPIVSPIPSNIVSPIPSDQPSFVPSGVPSDVPSLTPSMRPSKSISPSQTPSTSMWPSTSASSVFSPAPSNETTLVPWGNETECEDFPRDESLALRLVAYTDLPTLLTNSTSQGMAFEYLLADSSIDVCYDATLEQKYALATLFFATQGNDWINSTGWLVEPSECNWFQVQCNGFSEVSALIVVNNELNGTIPDELRLLTSLEELDISQNYLIGTIPRGLEELSGNLQAMRFARNNLEGAIPETLASLTALRELVLSDNMLTGSLPLLLLQMSSLENLQIDTNKIGGSLPAEIYLPALSVFHAHNNFLVGQIPDALWNSTGLTSLKLSYNALSGILSESIGTLTSLAYLDLSTNVLAGTLPLLLGRLSTLTEISLAENNFNGTLRDIFSSFVTLQRIDISANSLSGIIPAGLFDLASVQNIALHNNLLEGRIPDNWQNAAALTSLTLYGNRLTGSVPPIASGSLQSLVSVLLNGNQLTGSMPPSVCELRFDGVGALDILWADCGSTANPRIDCSSPECCTTCFPAEQRSYELVTGN